MMLTLFFLLIGVKMTQQGVELFGEERFVADGLGTQSECDQLIKLAQVSSFLKVQPIVNKYAL